MLLQQAHLLQRQAEKLTRKGKYQEAIQKHKEAADLLQQLIQQVTHEKAQESLRLQAEFHERQRKLLHQYQQKVDLIERSLKHIRLNRAMAENKSPDEEYYGFSQLKVRGGEGQQGNLQLSIYRTLEETETLLDRLRDQDPLPPITQSVTSKTPPEGTKMPKDDKTIIEELEVANSHLRRMVDSLFVELDHCQRENEELRHKIKRLEDELQESNVKRVAGEQGKNYAEEDELPPLEIPTFNYERN